MANSLLSVRKRGFHFRQLHILLPKICSTVGCQIRTQQISSLSGFAPIVGVPAFAARLDVLLPRYPLSPFHKDPLPVDAKPACGQAHQHLIAILQLTFRDALLQSRKSFFRSWHKAALRMAFSFSFRPTV